MSEPLTQQIDEPEQIGEPDPRPSASETREETSSNYRNKSTQTVRRQGTRSVRTQTVMPATSKSSPNKQVLECLSFPEAQAFSEVTAVVTGIENTQYHGETSTIKEVNFESITSSISEELAASHCHIPVNASSFTESDESSEEDSDKPVDKQTVLVERKLHKIRSNLFDKDQILDILGQCVQCGSKCIITAENQIGLCFKICIACSADSQHYFGWATGPCMSKMAAFHLLLASSILATGMELLKVLCLFQALKIPNLKQRELSNILKYYAIPVVYNVWNAEQPSRLQEVEGEPIVIASDMRVDSPGHSGLFGSGSTLDMTRNVILYMQAIKVNLIALKYMTFPSLLYIIALRLHMKKWECRLTFFDILYTGPQMD